MFVMRVFTCERMSFSCPSRGDSVSTEMIEITVNDRLGKKVRIKCNEDDTIGDLKKLIAAQTGTR